MLLQIATDGTERNTFVRVAVDGRHVKKLHLRKWISDDSSEGIVFEIDVPEFAPEAREALWTGKPST